MHILCTICSDLINQAENIYVTKCGHIFHYRCLKQWTQRSQTCPQCRHKVPESAMYRVYPTVSNEGTGEDVVTLQAKLDDAQLRLRQHQSVVKDKDDKVDELTAEVKKKEELIKSYEKKLCHRDSAMSALRDQLTYATVQVNAKKTLEQENENLKKNLQLLNGLQKVLNATNAEVEEMLQGYTDLATVATFATALKKALWESESKNKEYRDRLLVAQQQITKEKAKFKELQAEVVALEDALADAERKYKAVSTKRKAGECGMNMTVASCESSPKIRRPSDEFNTGMIAQNISFNSMVSKIEKADSPYLNLKQSSVALSALQRGPGPVPSERLKPSEMGLIYQQVPKETPLNKTRLGLLDKKILLKPTLDNSFLDVSYDGLGGHSKLDTFPVPNNRPPLRSCLPKVTAKHKLKRPEGTPDISKMLQKKT